MTYFISIIHILTACLIVLLILMQDSKGGGFSLGGGSSNTLFGTSGASHFLVKTTRWLALIFAITSLTLSSLNTGDQKSVLDDYETKSKTENPLSEKLPPLKENPASKNEGDLISKTKEKKPNEEKKTNDENKKMKPNQETKPPLNQTEK